MNTVSASRALRKVIIWLMVFGVLGAIAYGAFMTMRGFSTKRVTIGIGKVDLQAEVADTDELRQRGLAGRTELEQRQAMLFVAGQGQELKIWMKGMQMPIDIVWLDAKKKVVHIEKEVWPDDTPHTVYRSPVPATYVLEMKSGMVAESGVRLGTLARFDLEAAR